jgi:hypothetical protein
METKEKPGNRGFNRHAWRLTAALAIFAVLITCAAVCVIVFPHKADKVVVPPEPIVATRQTGADDPFSPKPQPSTVPAVAPQQQETATVSGMVINTRREPIAGAKVRLVPLGIIPGISPPAGTSTVSMSTTAEGTFSLASTAYDVDVMLLVDLKGYFSYQEKRRLPKAGVSRLEILMRKAASISGLVLDAKRQPVRDISVVVMRLGYEKTISDPTVDDGRFEIGPLNADSYGVMAVMSPTSVVRKWKQDMRLGSLSEPLATLDLVEGQQVTGYELVLPWDNSLNLSGTVVDEGRKPVPGASVWVSHVGPVEADSPLGIASAPTDARGRFQIASMGAMTDKERVDVHCVCDGYEPATEKNVAVGAEDTRIVLLKSRRGQITGVVLDKTTRQPIADARVFLAKVNASWGEESWPMEGQLSEIALAKGAGKVDGAGRFTIKDVQQGTVALTAYAPDYGLSQHMDLSVGSATTTEVELLLEPKGVLKMNLVYTGMIESTNIGACDIMCWPAGEIGKTYPITPYIQNMFDGTPPYDPGGRGDPATTYEFSLAPGSYDVTVTASLRYVAGTAFWNCRNHRVCHAQVLSGQTTETSIEIGGTAAIRGVVPQHENESRAMVYLLPQGSQSTFSAEFVYDEQATAAEYGEWQQVRASKEDYQYRLDNVRPGQYTACVAVETKEGEKIVRSFRDVSIQKGEELSLDFP